MRQGPPCPEHFAGRRISPPTLHSRPPAHCPLRPPPPTAACSDDCCCRSASLSASAASSSARSRAASSAPAAAAWAAASASRSAATSAAPASAAARALRRPEASAAPASAAARAPWSRSTSAVASAWAARSEAVSRAVCAGRRLTRAARGGRPPAGVRRGRERVFPVRRLGDAGLAHGYGERPWTLRCAWVVCALPAAGRPAPRLGLPPGPALTPRPLPGTGGRPRGGAGRGRHLADRLLRGV